MKLNARIVVTQGTKQVAVMRCEDIAYSFGESTVTITYQKIKSIEPIDDTCSQCGGPDALEPYSVLDSIWPCRKDEFLHLKCLEKRIGRRITASDLKPGIWNDMLRHIMSP